MKINLTDVGVSALKPPPRGQVTVWDSKSPLGVRISQGGTKTYVIFNGDGIRRTVGRTNVLSLSEARVNARRMIAERTLGIKAPEPVSGIRYTAAVSLFIAEHYRDKKPKTKSEVQRLLTNHFASISKMVLADITDRDISTQLAKLADRPSEQLHAFRALRVFFRWCVRPPHRHIRHSPLEGYPAPGKDRKGSRILTDRELCKVWNACEGLFGDMVRLLILWGARNGEIGRLQPQWNEGRVIVIPGDFTKNGRAHAIPLHPMARAILSRRKTNSLYYFPGHIQDSHFKDGSWGKLKKELDKRSGVTGWQCRDIRRTFRSGMAKLGVSRDLCEVLLNHVTGAGRTDLDEIYDRYDYLPEKRAALAAWELHLKKILALK